MNFKGLLCSFLVVFPVVAFSGCGDTDTAGTSYEANRPVSEDDPVVTDDPIATDNRSPGTTTGAQTPGAATGAAGDPPAASGDAAGSNVTGDVEEEPASDLPPESERQTESDAAQP